MSKNLSPNLLKTPKAIMMMAPHWTTLLLPTLVTPMAPMFSL